MAKKKIRPRDKFIADNTDMLARIIGAVLVVWYVSGLFAIDYVNPVVFLSIWIPIGLVGAFFAYKW
jgi:hypothetical protein